MTRRATGDNRSHGGMWAWAKPGMRWRVLIISLLLLMATAAVARPPGVIVAEVRQVPLADRIEALGTLKARESVVITANVTDSISALHFDDGDRVKAGAVLVEMMSGEEHALLEESKARVGEAERQYQRVKSLEASGSASASLLDERRRDIETARAALTATESRLADRLIKAPFDGVVGLRNISLGALVQPGDVITTLDDDARLKLDFAVPSVFLGTLAPGVEVEARTRAFPEQLFRGTISSLDSRVDPVTRSVQVRALIDNEQRLLRPGQLMTVELLRNPRQALLVPESALLHRGEEHFVFVVNDSDTPLVDKRLVEIGTRRPGAAEILSGLTAGEQVVTHGIQKVKPGAAVEVIAVDDGTRSLKELLSVHEK